MTLPSDVGWEGGGEPTSAEQQKVTDPCFIRLNWQATCIPGQGEDLVAVLSDLVPL